MIQRRADGFVVVEDGKIVCGPAPSRGALIELRKIEIRKAAHAKLKP